MGKSNRNPQQSQVLAWCHEHDLKAGPAVSHFWPDARGDERKKLNNMVRQWIYRENERIRKGQRKRKPPKREPRQRPQRRPRTRGDRLRAELENLMSDLEVAKSDDARDWRPVPPLWDAILKTLDELHSMSLVDTQPIEVRDPMEVATKLQAARARLAAEGVLAAVDSILDQDEDPPDNLPWSEWSAVHQWRWVVDGIYDDLYLCRNEGQLLTVPSLTAKYRTAMVQCELVERARALELSTQVATDPRSIYDALSVEAMALSLDRIVKRVPAYKGELTEEWLAEIADLTEWYARVLNKWPVALWKAWESKTGTSQRDVMVGMGDIVTCCFGGNRSGKTASLKSMTVLQALGRDHPAVKMWCLLNRCSGEQFQRGPGKVWMVALSSDDSIRYHRGDIDALLGVGGKKWWNRQGRGEARVQIDCPGYEYKAEIWFKSCQQGREGLQGDKVRFIGFDEEPPDASVMDEAKLRIGDLEGKIMLSMTPLKGLTWVYDRYMHGTPEEGSRVYTLDALNNPHIPRAFFRRLYAGMTEAQVRARQRGEFVAQEGLVYPSFARGIHVYEPFEIPADWDRYRAMDFGLANPACVLWAAVGPDGTIYVYREHYQAGWQIARHASHIRVAEQGETIVNAWADHSGRDEIIALRREHEIVFRKADKRFEIGRDNVLSMLAVRDDHEPRLKFHPDCINLIREIEGYVYPKLLGGVQAERPVKKNDHAMDALRYLVRGICRYLGLLAYIGDDDTEDEA